MLFKKIEINFGNKSMYRTPKDTINLLFKHGCLPGNLSPVMLPKKTIESIGLFNPEFTYVGDFEYWIRIVENNFGMAVNFSPLLELRHHKDRASISLGKIVWVRDICKCYKKLLEKNTLKKKQSIEGAQ